MNGKKTQGENVTEERKERERERVRKSEKEKTIFFTKLPEANTKGGERKEEINNK